MGQETLDERFADGAPTRGERQRHGWMTSNEQRFILWGLKEGWSAARIGNELGVNEATVRRFRAKFTKDADAILNLGLHESTGRARDEEHRCLVCGDQILGRQETERHVLRHFLDRSTVLEMKPEEAPRQEPEPHIQDAAPGPLAGAGGPVNPVEREAPAPTEQAPGIGGDLDRLIAQIGSDRSLEEMLSKALADVARQRQEAEGDTGTPPDEPLSPPVIESRPELESLTIEQIRDRRAAQEAEFAASEAGAPADADPEISLPAPGSGQVSVPPTSVSGQTPQTPSDDTGPSENALRREAFERLKAEASGGPEAPSTPPPPTAVPPGPTPPSIQGQTRGGATQGAPQIITQAPGEGAGRRAAFEHLRSQAEQREAAAPPTSDDESTRRRSELESILGEAVSPQSPPDAEEEHTPGGPETPSDSDERRDAFEQLRAQAASQEIIIPPTGAPTPPSARPEGSPPQGQSPPSQGGVDDVEEDTSEWHAAFARLAAEREGASEDEGPGVAQTPAAGPAATEPEQEEDTDITSWRRAMADLGAQHDDDDPDHGPDDTGQTSEGARGGAGIMEAPPEIEPEMTDSDVGTEDVVTEAEEAPGQVDIEPPLAPGAAEPADDAAIAAPAVPVAEEPAAAAGPSPSVAEEETQGPVGTDGDLPEGGEPEEGRPKGRRRFGSISLGSLRGAGSIPGLGSLARRGKGALAGLSAGSPSEVTAVTIESGYIKILVTAGREVLDHRIVAASPRLFREGLVSDTSRMAGLLKRSLQDVQGKHRKVIGAVPGYQNNLQRIEIPNVRGMDPNVVLPNEARRTMGISLDNSFLSWDALPGTRDTSNWLVISASNRSISSLSGTTESAGLPLTALELRPFAVARATNQPDAVFAWTAFDGCDAVVVRDWTPVTYQAAYWGAGASLESTDLVNRITEVVESTVDAHDLNNPEMSVPEDCPLFVYGTPTKEDDDIAERVARNLRRPTQEPETPLDLPEDFPVDDFIVNIGLSLWEG